MTPTTEIQGTPAGLQIVYYDKSHRYKIGLAESALAPDGVDRKLRWVPSVSTVLDKAVAKNLSGWVERLTVKGMVDLAQLGRPTDRLGPDAILAEMHSKGLRYYQARDAAAERGTNVHRAQEILATGEVPNVRDFPFEQRGYVQGLAKAWMALDFDVLFSELMVASWRWQYAGRLDLLVRNRSDKRVGVVDLKTSRAIRDSHHFQTAGYMIGVEECGYPKPDFGAVLRVGDDGTYEYVETWATAAQFLALKHSQAAQKEFELAGRKLAKEQAA